MSEVVVLLALLVAALATAVVVTRQQRHRSVAELVALRRELEDQRDRTLAGAIDTVVAMAREQLGAQVAAGAAQLDSSGALLGERLTVMHRRLDQVTDLVRELERDRQQRFGALTEQLTATGQATAALARTTSTLRDALARPQARGQWGERMAEDVLRAAGFVEGVNYHRQRGTRGGRPDFTFPLPGGAVLHMDVKFPLDNYVRALEAEGDASAAFVARFVRDVRARVAELAQRDYVDAEQHTLDYVLLFIPNEHVYAFVHEHDRGLIDHALQHRVVLCSPLTLFAVLAVVRQAVDNFALEATSHEILELLGAFGQQWERFTEAIEKVGRGLDTTRRAYDDLNGTRRRQLERQLDRIDDLRRETAPAPAPAASLVALRRDDDPGGEVAATGS